MDSPVEPTSMLHRVIQPHRLIELSHFQLILPELFWASTPNKQKREDTIKKECAPYLS
jgi:hypothetical protein